MNKNSYSYIDIAVGLAVNDPYTYKIQSRFIEPSLIGRRALIPFRNRLIIGYIVSGPTHEYQGDQTKVKEIAEIIDTQPILKASLLALTYWMSQHYMCSWGEAIENALPAYLKKKRKSIEQIVTRKHSKLESKTGEPFKNIRLNNEQKSGLEIIEKTIQKGEYKKFLLFGVTASGKTEVYVQAIKKVLAGGKSAICLFPEIALTTHLQNYFLYHFGEDLAIVHSRLTPQEKYLGWKEIFQGKKRVVIGPRSALFAPLKDIGIIIIDEEHENTYKQNETPRYHTRTVARERAEREGAVLIMGGATPSLEAMYDARQGETELLTLTKRVIDRPLPNVKIIDMKHEVRNKKIVLISQYLKKSIEDTLSQGEGILLFLNRRGFATYVSCLKCGFIIECKRCRVPMTYHQSRRKLVCHYCDKVITPPQSCPKCSSKELHYGGVGTEKIESFVARLFPQARIERMDTDRVRKKGEHEKILTNFKNKKIDILIGTQMITKGFDFPHVTLVGVVNADTSLALPDFRSTERTFQLLTQVAGRAGRGSKEGTVIIQTFLSEHYAIKTASRHDYEAFYKEEIKRREELNYPPFSDLVNIIMRGRNEKQVRDYSTCIKELLEVFLKGFDYEMIGPAPLPFYRLKGFSRWHIMLKGDVSIHFIDKIRHALSGIKKKGSCQHMCDVEPVNIL